MSLSPNPFDLPEEIILKVLEDADYRAILACKRVCPMLLYPILHCLKRSGG
jgi:hypothetical protein